MTTLAILNVEIPSVFAVDKSGIEPSRYLGFTKQNIHIVDSTINSVDTKPASTASPSWDGNGYIALPGFVDLHVHGAMGTDTMDASPHGLVKMGRFLASHGVTAFCPTTMTAPHEDIVKAVKAVASVSHSKPQIAEGPRILGVHIEGPYISPQFPGAQPGKFIRPPNLAEFHELLTSGPLSLLTLAPEAQAARELIEAAQQAGVVSVMGHTNASYETCMSAVTWGVSQATHTYNAMSGLHHRQPGTLGAVLSCDQIDAQLIADMIHVHPAAMKILARCKGVERTILITDAMQATGLGDGEYTLGGQQVTVHAGECRLADGTLAGSILTMDNALKNFMTATELSLSEAWPTSSQNAARSLGLDGRMGAIQPGYLADLVLLDDALDVVATVVGGQFIYQRRSVPFPL